MGDLHLDRLIALGDEMPRLGDHPIAARATEAAAAIDRDFRTVMAPEPMQRQARSLAHHIPQRDVDGRLRHHRHTAPATGDGGAPEILPDRLHLRRITANNARRHGLLQAGGNGVAQRQVQQMQIAHAGQTRGGDHLHHHQIAHRPQRVMRQPWVIRPGNFQQGCAQFTDGQIGHASSYARSCPRRFAQ